MAEITETPAAATETVETPAATPKAEQPRDNEGKYRRLFEKSEADLKETKAERDARLADLEAEREARTKAEARANDLLKRNIALEAGLSGDDVKFLQGGTEEELKAAAVELAARIGSKPAAEAPPVKAGTTTQPGAPAAQSIEDRIAAADKAGNTYEAIRLQREQAGFKP